MFQLKHYQTQTLETLSKYFKLCVETGNPKKAFKDILFDTPNENQPYTEISGLEGLPYICLRLPTGGGKTLLGCHCVAVANRDFLHQERSVVLWLVPSNTIRDQTLNALKNRQHPYRQALDALLGSVTPMEVSEALYLQRSVLDSSTVIIVSTNQAFRVDDTELRKVYESAGALHHHFSGLEADQLAALEKNSSGSVIYSLANVLRLRRPIVVVDEAHNVRTELSFETLTRFRPSCIVELTATPDKQTSPSNVLCAVSAKELQAEDMIKLPIRLETNEDWKQLLSDAIATREGLERDAKDERKATGEYVRPIMLLKADRTLKDRPTLNVEASKKALIEDFHIPEDQLKIATGTQDELGDVDLFDENCPVRFIITVDKLREGWDCSFAYVLCALGEMSSSTAVEQILGRVLRLPQAKSKTIPSLNRAYAFSVAGDFWSAARNLENGLINNGFNPLEARDLIVQRQDEMLELPLSRPFTPARFEVSEDFQIQQLPSSVQHKIEYDRKSKVITTREVLSHQDVEVVKAAFKNEEIGKAFQQLIEKQQTDAIFKYPAERNEPFSLPMLSVEQNGELQLFEDSIYLDRGWRLLDYIDKAKSFRYAIDSTSRMGEVRIEEGKVRARELEKLLDELKLLEVVENWTQSQFVGWIDRNILHHDIIPDETEIFINACVQSALSSLSLGQLVRDRYKFCQKVEELIDARRKEAKKQLYQESLFKEVDGQIVVTPERCFTFPSNKYPCREVCSRSGEFKKHYHHDVGDLKESGEEFDCAKFLDGLPEVKFWIRNIERHPDSFWLQTSTDKFYPDFVCALNDGRFLVVEYKGEHLWDNADSDEKRILGELWANKSGGKCLFVMPKGRDFEAIRRLL